MDEAVLKSYHVKWHSESANSSESMPAGGGDIGLNVWVEKHELLFYISRSGTIDENGQMLKLGRCRLRLDPNPFAGSGAFLQELDLSNGCVRIDAQGEHGPVTLQVWVEVDRPVIRVELEASHPVTLSAVYESWRMEPRLVENRDPCSTLIGYPGEVYTLPDCVHFEDDAVWFCHRNDNRALKFDDEVKLQGLEAHKDRIYHPTKDLVFGGRMGGEGLSQSGIEHGTYMGIPYQGWRLQSEKPCERHDLHILLHTSRVPDAAEWKRQIQAVLAHDRDPATSRRVQQAWWKQFWERSYIAIRPDRPYPSDPIWQVGRNYQLFRYMLACNAYGEEPTKFNGGLFTFDPVFVKEQYAGETPDFRRWGGSTFTAQNQRLVYWPMLKSGDSDMMHAQFDFYRKALGTAELRSEVYWGHGGCAFAEQLNHTGLPTGREYGWNRREGLDPGVEDNNWVNYEYVHQLDFAYMILQSRRYGGVDLRRYLPFIEGAIRFFDEHYQFRSMQETGSPLDENGHLRITPSTALETFKNAVNPSDVISGMTAVLKELLQLPEDLAVSSRKKQWLDMLNRVPPIPYEVKDGKRTIAPAASWSHVQNVEIPQLYPLFPFGLYGIGRPDLQTAIHTWKHSVYHEGHRQHVSWHQGNIFTAQLGLTDEAAEFAVRKLADGPHRFPAFWGPGHDWTPDHNWGGSGMIGLQEMVMQTHGDAIYLLPAWPDDWNVDFKLHAPRETVVEGRYREGKLEVVKVSPEWRRKDIVNMKEQRIL